MTEADSELGKVDTCETNTQHYIKKSVTWKACLKSSFITECQAKQISLSRMLQAQVNREANYFQQTGLNAKDGVMGLRRM